MALVEFLTRHKSGVNDVIQTANIQAASTETNSAMVSQEQPELSQGIETISVRILGCFIC